MDVMKNYLVLLVFGVFLLKVNFLIGQTPECGGSGGSSFIQPSVSNVNALMIYTYFPSGGFSGTDEIPSFASTAAQHHEDYYDEMSYNTHNVNVQVFDPNNGDAFEADSSVSYYESGFGSSTKLTDLNTEILDKAWAEDNTVFNDVDVVFMFYGGGVFTRGTAWAVLNHNSSHYSGCGAIMEWGFSSVEEALHKWHLAHEYGHLLSTNGTSARRLFDQYTNQPPGIYNIMHFKHNQWLPLILCTSAGLKAPGLRRSTRHKAATSRKRLP